jgi:hypothetical protein
MYIVTLELGYDGMGVCEGIGKLGGWELGIGDWNTGTFAYSVMGKNPMS